MKINFDFYKDEINYNQLISLEIEEKIINNYILKYSRDNYKDILDSDLSTETHYVLSKDRENIINWYPFKKNCKILQIGAGLGELTGYLCEKAEKVVAIETSKKRVNAIAHRYKEKNNLEIYAGNIDEIKLDEKFDYVILIGVFEYAPKLCINSTNSYNELLQISKKYLKEDGIILLAMDNALSVENICGNKNEVCNSIYESLYEVGKNNKIKLFTKNEIEKVLQKNGFDKFKFYYPLPNYKLPNVIYSENQLPSKNSTKALYSSIYNEASVVVINEQLLINKLINNNLFENFANSFFIEIVNSSVCDINFVSFNNIRKEKYKLKLKIDSNNVVKEPILDESKNHIKDIKENIKELKEYGIKIIDNIVDEKIVSPYMIYDKLDDILIKHIIKEEFKEFYDALDSWYLEIKNKMLLNLNNRKIKGKDVFQYFDVEISKEKKQKLNFIKDGYIDLVFENVFINNDREFIFFDQEWYLNNIPFELIVYRAINNFYIFNPQVEIKVRKMDLFERYGIKEYHEELEKLEKVFQSKIIDFKKIDFYINMNRHKRDIMQLL